NGELAGTTWMNADGVGCESCHGPSARWLGPHTTIDWRQESRPVKEGLGLYDTKTLARRAEICAGCHVGDRSRNGLPARDVNHDLIAAGHPRLTFELASYLDNVPAHWDEQDENSGPVGPNQRAKDFSIRAWAIGQWASENAALDLTAGRAEVPGAPWPELSEYDCFACHHDLRDDPWRRKLP